MLFLLTPSPQIFLVKLAAPRLYVLPFSSVLRHLLFRSLVVLDSNNLFDITKGKF